MTEESLFLAALDRKDPDERRRFLDDACATDPDRRKRIEVLLAAYAAGQGKLEPPTVAAPTADFHVSPDVGLVIAGRYKLLERIGEGGMGEVWVARQTEPVQRKVALKLIKPGMDSKSVLVRFEAERQALAMMDHPNIAKVLDGGLIDVDASIRDATPGRGATGLRGRPFFVMELVNGLPLTKFCDEAKLTPRQRLELFIPVCQAVQHAHQKGIVHRDLKPSNILVTLYDGHPIPKVIDFGVAKATGGRLTEATISTQFGAVVGTFEYMAPEQAGFSALDVDTRADIYSLGVILYELLTGLRPFEGSRLRKAAIDELFRILREEDPPKPSTKLSTDASLPSAAAVRRTDPKKLTALMKGELDWIVMKCLEKDRSRRYETANGLARDVQRYLADEPVEARPPSRGYRLRKLLRRNRGPVLAAGLVVLALTAGLVGTAVGLVRADAQRARAVTAEAAALAQARATAEERDKAAAAADAERAAKQGEADQRQKAEESLAESQAIGRHLTRMLGELKDSPRPGAKSAEITIRELLDQAAKDVTTSFAGRPKLEAAVRYTIGENYKALGAPEQEREQFEQALRLRDQHLGPDHPETIAAALRLAECCHALGDYQRAEPLYRRVVAARTAALGRYHLDTLKPLAALAAVNCDWGRFDRAAALFAEVRAGYAATVGPDHPDALEADLLEARLYMSTGRPDRATALYARVLAGREAALGPDHPETLRAVGGLAVAYTRGNDLVRTGELLHRTVNGMTRVLGPNHLDTLQFQTHLAALYVRQGRFDAAVDLYRVVEDGYARHQMETARLRAALARAMAYWAAGKPDLAAPLARQTLTTLEERFAATDPVNYYTLGDLAFRYRSNGRPDVVALLFEQVVAVRTARAGADHPDTLGARMNLGNALREAGQLDRSTPLFEHLVEACRAKLGEQHPSTLEAKFRLAECYRDAGRPADALPLTEQAYRAGNRMPGGNRLVRPVLFELYARLGRGAEAAALVREDLAAARKSLPAGSPDLAAALAASGLALLRVRAWVDAEAVLRECLATREREQPDAWTTFNTRSMLGGALLGQQKYAEAEPLLLAGYTGMKARETQIPLPGRTRLPDAAARLAELYQATGRPVDAAKWRAELATYPPPVERGPPPREAK